MSHIFPRLFLPEPRRLLISHIFPFFLPELRSLLIIRIISPIFLQQLRRLLIRHIFCFLFASEAVDYSFPGRAGEDGMEGNTPLLPNLPDDIAIKCLARVPLRDLWGVCRQWQRLLYNSSYFQRIRSSHGKIAFQWLYALVQTDEGLFKWYAFDPLACRWHGLPPMPDHVRFQWTSPGYIGRFHAVQCVGTQGKLVVVAGSKLGMDDGGDRSNKRHLQPALERPLVFDAEKLTWSEGPEFGVPRKWCACGAVDDGKIYVASGCGADWDVGVSKSAEIYDVAEASWERVDGLNSSKFSGEPISAVCVGGKVHMVSGKGVMMKEGIVYDLSSRCFSKMCPAMLEGWTGVCVGMSQSFYALQESIGRLQVFHPTAQCWVSVVESEMLRGVSQLAASNGKICGIRPGGPDVRISVVDVAATPPKVFHVDAPPMGRPVAIQVLSRMGPA